MFNSINVSLALDPNQELSLDDLDLVLGGGSNAVSATGAGDDEQQHASSSSYTGSTGLGIPAAQEILNQQIIAAARPVVEALETGVYYLRQATAEAIRFATDPVGHTGEVIADQVQPDGPPPHSSK
jgi:hypothetical protein